MKKRAIITIALLAMLLAGGVYLNNFLTIITGYAAKNLASGVFVSGRTQESMENEDLNFSYIRYAFNTVDYEKKKVTSRFLWNSSKAIYVDRAGCILVNDFTADEIQERPYTRVVYPKADTTPWPQGDLIADSIPSGVDIPRLRQAVERIMTDSIPFKGTFALMITYKGQPVAEAYRSDFNRDTRFLSWSMAKSVTSALAGIRSKENKIDIHAPLNLEVWENDGRREITLNNLLQMNSGLEWDEGYGGISDVTVMLHKTGDMARYTACKELQHQPGTYWFYSSGSTNIASFALRRSFNNDGEYLDFPYKELFGKTGMYSTVFETDASGTFAGSSYVYATMRDYMRFGLLYLNRGNWRGQQILADDWINYTLTPAEGSEGQYGASFWLNKSGKMPDAPADAFWCSGHDGQNIIIVPSRQLVVVRTGFSKSGEYSANKMMKEILQAFANHDNNN